MKKFLLGFGLMMLPVLASAQASPDFNYVRRGVEQIYTLANTFIIPALMLAAFGFFLWGAIGYVRADSTKKKEKRDKLIQGVIALAIMVSVWGLVALLQNVFGVRGSATMNTVCPPGFRPFGANCLPQ